jgi:hypothetical protein
MNLIFFRRNKMDKEGNKHDNGGKSVKCKYCKMGFENKERLKVHSKNSTFWKRRKKKE